MLPRQLRELSRSGKAVSLVKDPTGMSAYSAMAEEQKLHRS
jgi:hypothetical protein